MSPRNRRTTAAGSVLVLVLTFLCWLSVGDAPTVFVPPPDAQSTEAAPARLLGPPADYAEVAQRPLFSPRRLPPQPKTEEPPVSIVTVAAPSPPRVLTAASVLGVAIGPDSKAAIVRLASGATATVKEGEDLDGWRLTKIAVDHITFELDGTDKEIFFPAAKDNPSKAPRRALPAAPRPR